MVLYRVHSEPALRKFYSSVFSAATLFQIILYCLVIIPPFFIAYATNDLWQYTSSYREQPAVSYQGRYIVQVGDDSVDGVWSTFPNLNRLLEPTEVAIPVLRFHEDDRNRDGTNDVLYFTLEFTALGHSVQRVQLMLFFEVQLSLFSSVTFPSLVYVSQSSVVRGRRLWVGGELAMRQTVPLPASGRVENFNTSLFDYEASRAEEFDLSSILSSYMDRNVSTVLSDSYVVWERQTLGDNFTLEVELLYPIQTITYMPGFWQLLKFAWIQYLALLVLFWCVLRRVQSFVFQNNIVMTTMERKTKHKQY